MRLTIRIAALTALVGALGCRPNVGVDSGDSDGATSAATGTTPSTTGTTVATGGMDGTSDGSSGTPGQPPAMCDGLLFDSGSLRWWVPIWDPIMRGSYLCDLDGSPTVESCWLEHPDVSMKADGSVVLTALAENAAGTLRGMWAMPYDPVNGAEGIGPWEIEPRDLPEGWRFTDEPVHAAEWTAGDLQLAANLQAGDDRAYGHFWIGLNLVWPLQELGPLDHEVGAIAVDDDMPVLGGARKDAEGARRPWVRLVSGEVWSPSDAVGSVNALGALSAGEAIAVVQGNDETRVVRLSADAQVVWDVEAVTSAVRFVGPVAADLEVEHDLFVLAGPARLHENTDDVGIIAMGTDGAIYWSEQSSAPTVGLPASTVHVHLDEQGQVYVGYTLDDDEGCIAIVKMSPEGDTLRRIGIAGGELSGMALEIEDTLFVTTPQWFGRVRF